MSLFLLFFFIFLVHPITRSGIRLRFIAAVLLASLQYSVVSYASCKAFVNNDSRLSITQTRHITKFQRWQKIKVYGSKKRLTGFKEFHSKLLLCLDYFEKLNQKKKIEIDLDAYKHMISAFTDLYLIVNAPSSGKCYYHYLDKTQFNNGQCRYYGKIRPALLSFAKKRYQTLILNYAKVRNKISY